MYLVKKFPGFRKTPLKNYIFLHQLGEPLIGQLILTLTSHWSMAHTSVRANCGLIWGHWGNMMLRVMFPGLCQNIAIYRYETRPSINPLNWGHNNCMGHLLLRCRVPFLQLWFSSFCHDIGEP